MVLDSLYFFLPAYFANMAPVLLKWIPFFDKPIHKKKFGKNKTWRGLVVAPLVGGLIFFLQKLIYSTGFTKLALIDYSGFSVLLGFLLGSGAILGDLMKSYFKRKRKIKAGKPWPFWDQLDFVFGALLFGGLVYVPPAETVLILLVASPLLHISINHVGYYLGIRKIKF
jgi:CDP-2,3-bis-(O-geranylgeranyl)-sn-glycerol synthase